MGKNIFWKFIINWTKYSLKKRKKIINNKYYSPSVEQK